VLLNKEADRTILHSLFYYLKSSKHRYSSIQFSSSFPLFNILPLLWFETLVDYATVMWFWSVVLVCESQNKYAVYVFYCTETRVGVKVEMDDYCKLLVDHMYSV